jgi:hypothetical protein
MPSHVSDHSGWNARNAWDAWIEIKWPRMISRVFGNILLKSHRGTKQECEDINKVAINTICYYDDSGDIFLVFPVLLTICYYR